MPEAPVAPAPTTAPSAAPTPAAAPTAPAAPSAAEPPSGIKAAMEKFSEHTTPKPKAAPAPKPGETTPPAKPPTPEPPKAPEDIWAKAPEKLRNEFFKNRREYDEKISTYEKRIKDIENKSKESPGDAKLVENYQKRITELEQNLAATDYRQSGEFKKNFVDRYNSEYTAAVNEVKQLQITTKDQSTGEERTRPATQADFDYIRALPAGQQDRAMKELFGDYGQRIFGRLMRLQDISDSADRALQDHASNAEKTTKEKAAASDREHREYNEAYERSVKELEKEFPDLFASDEKDPDRSAALVEGFKWVDDIEKALPGMGHNERAASKAVLRARAALAVSKTFEANRLKSQVESLTQELKKYRNSDPGSGDETATGEKSPTPSDIPQGIAAAAKLAAGKI